jgi:hypothetical protein
MIASLDKFHEGVDILFDMFFIPHLPGRFLEKGTLFLVQEKVIEVGFEWHSDDEVEESEIVYLVEVKVCVEHGH